ncbi:MAG: molybdate ABC transporter substrate-binding protein [Bacteroidota bacterium]
MSRFRWVAMSIVLWVWVVSCTHHENDKLTIATAANMRFAIDELVETFSEETDIECQLIISSSGALTAQIMEGAPYDVFVAANMSYPTRLFESGFSEAPPAIYAYGTLVLWTLGDSLPAINALTGKNIRHIAIANPKLAPYGTAAIEFLKNLGIYNEVEDKLVFGESLAQTNQFIASKAANVGITSMSTVLAPGMQNKGVWKALDEEIYPVIEQGVVKVKKRNIDSNAEQADRFMVFLFSDTGKNILKRYGYRVND